MKLRFWYMVHGKRDSCPSPLDMRSALRPAISGLDGQFEPSDGDWRNGRLTQNSAQLGANWPVVSLSRVFPGDEGYLWSRDGFIEGLKSELTGPHAELVFDHLHQVKQSITVVPLSCDFGSAKLARICEQLCGFLAESTDGLIHVYQEGIFNREGESLLPYNPKHKLKTR